MSGLIAVYATIGHGRRAKAYEGGRLIGYSELRGSHTHYYDTAGRGLGYSEVQGSETILCENGGQAVARYRRT